jgi:type II secretory pathway pseudopilin PulG
MTIRLFLLATACVGIALAAISFRMWQSDVEARRKLKAAIAAQQQLIAQLDTQEHMRAQDLKATTDQVDALKRRVNSPDEAVRDLPQYLQLPAPITSIPKDEADGARNDTTANTPASETSVKPTTANLGAPISSLNPLNTGFYLPSVDAKPLFDFVQDSRLCQLQLSSARSDLQDERVRSTDLANERDQAVRATKGEATIHRLGRDAKWLLIGAALTAFASLPRRSPEKINP